jgi:hypothetical protein
MEKKEAEKEKKKKHFIITKNKDEYITLEYKELFDDPCKYLQSNTKFIIGHYSLNKQRISKSLINQKLSKSNPKIQYIKSKECYDNNNNKTNEYFDKKDSKTSLNNINIHSSNNNNKNKKRCMSALNPKRKMNYDLINRRNKSRNFLKLPNTLKSSDPLKSIHYEFKTPKQIIEIFKKFKKDEGCEKINLFSKKIDDIYDKKYSLQEKYLNYNRREKKKLNYLSKYLSKKCEKKEENLLVNKIDEFNIKRQIVNYYYYQKLLSEKLGNNYWICNLRRPKNDYKINYVNTGRNDKEPWEQIVDSGDSEIEIINNPSSQFHLDNTGSMKYLKYINNYPNLKSFSQIKIDGKNLFNQEYNNFINSIDNNNNKSIKYKLYKDPQEKKSKSIQELLFKENYRPLSRQKKLYLKRKII